MNDRNHGRPEPTITRQDPPLPVMPVLEYDIAAREVLARRLAGERAHYERGFPVAGHDFEREARERERER